MTEARPLPPGKLLVGGCPEGFDARYLARTIGRAARAGDPCRARRRAAGGDARGAAVLRARAAGADASRPGTACPTTGSRRTPRSRPRGWRRWRRSPTGFDRPAAVLTTVNAVDPARARRATTLRASSFTARGGRARRRGGAARLPRADGLHAGADGDRARRLRGARRHHRRLSAGHRRAGAARPVRRRARQRAALRSGDPAHHREGEAGGARAGVRGDPRRGRRSQRFRTRYRDDVRRGGRRRSALRGGQRGAQAPGLRALAAVLPRAAGDAASTTCPARRCCSTTSSTPAHARALGRRSSEQYDARAAALAAKARLGTVYKPAPPGELYLDEAALGRGARRARRCTGSRALPQPLGAGRHRRGRADRAGLRARAAARER